jgi:hypothetical protein
MPGIEGAAIAAGIPWLSFSCSGCGQYALVDLRTLDRYLGGAISSLIPSVSCRRCSPNAPFAKLETLTGGSALITSKKKGAGCMGTAGARRETIRSGRASGG